MRRGEKTNRSISRETNLELLRVIAMLMIILHHFALYSGFGFLGENGTSKRVVVDVLGMFGKLGVTLFIMISGCFYDRSKFKLNKFVKLLITVWTYSIIGLTIGIIIKSNELNFINIVKSIFPIIFGRYWFATCYIVIYIFAPYTKDIVDKMERKQLKNFLLLAFIIWSVIAIVPKTKTFVNEFIILELVYLLGAYIKKYDINILKNKRRLFYIVSIILCMIIIMATLENLSNEVLVLKNNDGYIKYFNQLQSPFIIVLTILIFNAFRNLNIKKCSLINLLASNAFGVYLIHDNIFLRNVIWQKLFILLPKTSELNLIISGIIETILVFIICACIDMVMQNTVIKILKELVLYLCTKTSKLKIYNKVKKIVD